MRNLLLFVAAVLCALPPAHARETLVDGARASVTEENDKFVLPSTDKHYTQGLHVSVLWPDERVPLWVNPMTWWPDFGMQQTIHKYGFRVGQEIYTPANTRTNGLLRNDRPYAGWFYLGLARENRGTIAGNIPVRDLLAVDIGVVGRWAQAQDSQVWFHGVVKVEEPRGWRHQLENEPGLLISFNRQLLLWDSAREDEPFHLQLLPHVGLNLGNIETSAILGARLRAGYNFPNEFAANSPPRWGWYVFSGLDVRAVAYNMFLDGNLYHDSHQVAKEPAVLHLRLGAAVILKRVEFSYTYNYLSPEFKKQSKHDAYGTFNLTWHF